MTTKQLGAKRAKANAERIFVVATNSDYAKLCVTTLNRYGAAIRFLRKSQKLKQADIHGITERQLRRVEHGEQAVSKPTLEALAKSHSLSLDGYLDRLAKVVATIS